METYHKILEREFSFRLKRNPSYSLRSFAKSMGVNHGALSQIFSGSRVPSFKIMKKIIEKLNLSEKENFEFQRSIAKAHVAKKPKRLNPDLRNIASQTKFTKESFQQIEMDKFNIISEWYHYAIFCMIQKDNFVWDETAIAKKLGISPIQAKMAIYRLKSLNLITEDNETLKCLNLNIDTANKEKTTVAHKKRIKQILKKSQQSIDNQELNLRNHATMTMAIDPKKIPEAKVKIQNFVNDLCAFLESGEKLEIYEFATSLFSLEKTGAQL